MSKSLECGFLGEDSRICWIRDHRKRVQRLLGNGKRRLATDPTKPAKHTHRPARRACGRWRNMLLECGGVHALSVPDSERFCRVHGAHGGRLDAGNGQLAYHWENVNLQAALDHCGGALVALVCRRLQWVCRCALRS